MKIRRLRDLLRTVEKTMWNDYKINLTYTCETLKNSSNLQRVVWKEIYQGKGVPITTMIFNWGAVKADAVNLVATQTLNYLYMQCCNYNALSLNDIERLIDVDKGYYTGIKASEMDDVAELKTLYTEKLIVDSSEATFPFDILVTDEGKETLKHLRQSLFIEI